MGIRATICRAGLTAALLAAPFAGGSAVAQTAIKFTLDSRIDGTSAPFMTAIDRGFFKAEQVSVTVDPAADAAEAVNRVATGAYEMGFVDINQLIRYRDQANAVPVTAVFMVYNKPTYAIIGRKSRGVSTPKDLKDKKLGAPAGDLAFAQWKLFAQINGIEKVNIENVGFPVREPLLQNGQVDAIIGLSYVMLPNLKAMNIPADDIVLLMMADYGLKLYDKAVIVNPKFAAEKPDAVRQFLQGYVRGLKETARNPTAAVENVIKRNDTLIKEIEVERMRIVLRDNIHTQEVKSFGYGGIDFARLDQAIDQLASVNEFKSKPKSTDIFDPSFLPTALSRRPTH